MGFRQITLAEIKQMALDSKEAVESAAAEHDRPVMVYGHWSAGRYNQFFSDYHINIDDQGRYFTDINSFADLLEHTWHRNSGAIGLAFAACLNATENDLGEFPPTALQVESMAQAVAVLGNVFERELTTDFFLTHAEAANIDGYGLGSGDPETRWDLWVMPGLADGEGGHTVRGKGIFYQIKWRKGA